MTNRVATLDLNRLLLDVDSFLGRALALGRKHGSLSERFESTLTAYLRIQSLSHAQRYRTGIAIGRDALRTGVERCFTCLDLALEESAAGDLNAAVDTLAGGDFQALRRRGWEIAFFRLEEMQRECELLSALEELSLLPELAVRVRTWAAVVPETWTATEPEGETVGVDPRLDFTAYAEVAARVRFVRSLPRAAARSLLASTDRVRSFDAILRRLVLAVALERETLNADADLIGEFRGECLEDGRMREAVRERVSREIADYLDSTLDSRVLRNLIQGEFDEETERLSRCSQEGIQALFFPADVDAEDEAPLTSAASPASIR